MSSMKSQRLQRWLMIKEKGMMNFVLKRGFLGWGLPMCVFMAFISKPFEQGFTSNAAISHYITWLVGGVFFGLMLWFVAYIWYEKLVR